ncbi:MAG: DUF5668 domain-containing protein [Anaerolineales bacterium]
MEAKPRRGSLIGPVILIGLGVVFLLDNLGVVHWDIWQIVFRLWPVLLIAAGLDLVVGRRSTAGTLVVVLVMVGLTLAGVWLLSDSLTGTAQTETLRQVGQNAQRAEVEIDGTVGVLRVGTHHEPDVLILGTADLSPGEQLRKDFRVEEGTAYYTLGSRSVWHIPSWGGLGDRVWDLRLSRDLPVRLSVSAGVGETILDLADLQATEVKFSAGVGRSAVTLPATGQYSATIDGGVGEVTIQLPQGLAARITVSTGIGGVEVVGDFQRDGDVYLSPGFETAQNRVELDISGGIGRIVIHSGG